jgi:hypothetical protein
VLYHRNGPQECTEGLRRAVEENHFKLAELLLQHYADVNGRDGRGRTALHQLCFLQHHNDDHHQSWEEENEEAPEEDLQWREWIALLLQHGADINLQDYVSFKYFPVLIVKGTNWMTLLSKECLP